MRLACLIFALAASPAAACFLDGMPEHRRIGTHPSAPLVKIAVKRAERTGQLQPLPDGKDARFSALWDMRWRVMGFVEALAFDGARGAPVSVYLTQSGAWFRLNDPVEGAVYHTSVPQKGEPVVVLPDTALMALLEGRADVAALFDAGVLAVTGDAGAEAVFAAAVTTYQSMQGTH